MAGSSGAFFHVADTIIQMDAYRPKDVKMSVEALLPEYPPADLCSNAEPFTLPTEKRTVCDGTEDKAVWSWRTGGTYQDKK